MSHFPSGFMVNMNVNKNTGHSSIIIEINSHAPLLCCWTLPTLDCFFLRMFYNYCSLGLSAFVAES